MHDVKNILLACFSYWLSVVLAIDLTIVTAIVLPTLFFTIGKAIDVILQIYLHHRRKPER